MARVVTEPEQWVLRVEKYSLWLARWARKHRGKLELVGASCPTLSLVRPRHPCL